MSEKTAETASAPPSEFDTLEGEVIEVPGYDSGLQWEPAEQKRALLKADFFILPFIILLFCFLQFDRTNIGNALTDTLRKDIHVTNTQINLAQTMFILGFVTTGETSICKRLSRLHIY